MPTHSLDEQRLTRLIDAGRSLVTRFDPEEMPQRLLEVARELTGARYAALGILDDRRRELERFITLGIDEPTRLAIGDPPRGRGILGLLIGDPQPLRLADVGEHPRSYGFPAGHPPMRTFLGVPIRVRGEVYGNLYLCEKEGGAEFDEADEQAIVVLADWAAVAIENARLYTDVQDRRDELERAVRRLEATTAIARAVGGETDLNRVLELIVKRGRALVDARSLLILLEDHGDLVVAATAGELTGEVRGARLAVEGSLPGEVLRSGRPERLADLSSRLRSSLGTLGVDATTALLAPMSFRGSSLGVLAAFDRMVGGRAFGAEDEALLTSFAASAATAVATAQSVAEDRLRLSIEASEGERRRWARELHDETLQGLGALRVLLSSALQRGAPESLEEAARTALSHIGSEIEKLRALITELRPAALDELGLEPALDSLAARVAAVEGLHVDLNADLGSGDRAAPRLTPELEGTIYRLVQEALTNVAKHAAAERVSIEVVEREDTVWLAIRDDGVGFDARRPTSGFGLVGMRERVALAGGKIEFETGAGAGTTVRARFPAQRTPAPAAVRRLHA